MAEPDDPVNQDDFSPELGGARAPEPEIPEPPSGSGPLGDEFARLFGAGAQPELDDLVATFGLFGQTLQSLVTETIQVIETRLPQTLEAFEGLLDAVNQVFDESESPSQTQEPQQASSEVQDQDL